MLITSLDNKKIKHIVKLRNKKYRDEEGLFVVEIPNVIEEAYKNGLLKELYIKDGFSFDIDFNYDNVSCEVLNKIKTLSVTNVIGVIKKPENGVLKGDKYILLDEVSDPGNLGTIIRSALAFDIDTLVIGDNCCDLYNDKVIRATEGAIFKMNIVFGNLENVILSLKDNGVSVYGTDVSSGADIRNVECEKIAVVMGSEGNGLSKKVKELVDGNLYIKTNNVESLNVGVATSIIMYEIMN